MNETEYHRHYCISKKKDSLPLYLPLSLLSFRNGAEDPSSLNIYLYYYSLLVTYVCSFFFSLLSTKKKVDLGKMKIFEEKAIEKYMEVSAKLEKIRKTNDKIYKDVKNGLKTINPPPERREEVERRLEKEGFQVFVKTIKKPINEKEMGTYLDIDSNLSFPYVTDVEFLRVNYSCTGETNDRMLVN
jgi:hypothetical protein